MADRRRRLLFLIADTGGGHRASATAVARELERSHPGEHEVRIVDPFSQPGRPLLGKTASLYGPLAQHGRWLWGALWHATNSRAAVAGLHRSVLRLARRVIAREADSWRPDAIVSFHPLLNHAAAAAAARHTPRIPVITVITDLVDVHASWACRDVDAVVAASPGGFERARRAGVPASRCHLVGLPVGEPFRAAPITDTERRSLRASLGLRPGAFTVLVCGGADGSGSIPRRATALVEASLDVQVAVICGRNARARRRLAGLRDRGGEPVLVMDYVTNMADWMRAADLVVTKAGPGTIAEALCCGVPLLLTWYLPGQERGNVEWVVDIGAGRYVPRLDQLVDAVAELSSPGSASFEAMRTAVKRAARPDATAAIAGIIARAASGDPDPAAQPAGAAR